MIIQIKNLLNNYSIKVKEGKAIKITNLVMKSQHKKAKVETTKNTKGKIKRTEPVQANKMCYQQKKKYFICKTLHRNIKVNTKYKSRAEIENIKKEKTEKNTTKPTNENGVDIRKKKECTYRQTRKKDKMAVLSPHLLIITLNVNGLNSPIKRHRVAGWIKK